MRGTVAAALVSGLPSTVHAAWTGGVGAVPGYLCDATRAAGTLLPPGRPSLVRGAFAHAVVSAACGVALGRALPERRSVAWGAGGGAAIGLVNVGLIGRAFPAIRSLPLAPQIADNAMFGAVFAAVADRSARPAGPVCRRTSRVGRIRAAQCAERDVDRPPRFASVGLAQAGRDPIGLSRGDSQ